MRYIVAAIAACLLLAIAAAFCRHTHNSLINYARKEIRKPENAAEMTAEARAKIEVQLDKGILPDMDIEVPPSLMPRMSIASLLKGLWYFWVPVTFGACFAVARFLVRQKGQLRVSSTAEPGVTNTR